MTKQTTFYSAGTLADDFWAQIRTGGGDFSTDTLALVDFVNQHPTLARAKNLCQYSFSHPQYLLESLTHTSMVHEKKSLGLTSYERLEFLGDSVLGLLVSTQLMEKFPDLSEGELSRFRSSLVNENSLAELGEFINLSACLLLGRGELKELKEMGRMKSALMADVFEAFFGAIYRDGGFFAAEKSFASLLDAFFEEKGHEFIRLDRLYEFDAKSRLQELTMSKFRVLPEYRAKEMEDQNFRVELWVRGVQLLSETNISKKKAEHSLAKRAVKNNLLDQLDQQ